MWCVDLFGQTKLLFHRNDTTEDITILAPLSASYPIMSETKSFAMLPSTWESSPVQKEVFQSGF